MPHQHWTRGLTGTRLMDCDCANPPAEDHMTIIVDMTPYQKASITFGEDPDKEASELLNLYFSGKLTWDEMHHVIESLIEKASQA